MTRLLFLLVPVLVFSHPGRVDFKGGHTDSSTGLYHYHKEKAMFKASVVRVVDGDTLVVNSDSTNLNIRLNGVDAPEIKQEFGQESKKWLEAQCAGKDVMVIVRSMDKYARLVCDVFTIDSVFINQLMVEDGMAWVYDDYTDDPLLEKAESRARAKSLGLWKSPNPIPPWEFRKDR